MAGNDVEMDVDNESVAESKASASGKDAKKRFEVRFFCFAF